MRHWWNDSRRNRGRYASREQETARLKAELETMTKNRDECAAVFKIDREHELTGPIVDCGCPSCVLHHKHATETARLREALRWIPVEERLPDGGLILALVPPNIMGVAYLAGKIFMWPDVPDDREAIGVTHWRPLPDPPECDEGRVDTFPDGWGKVMPSDMPGMTAEQAQEMIHGIAEAEKKKGN